MTHGKISVVVPAFNEAENLPSLVKQLRLVLDEYDDFEILIVDDGSQDRSLEILRAFAADDRRIQYLSLSRNFGHQSALKAGLDWADGDCVVSLDADLQHPPELIAKMVQRWREGYEIVNMVRCDDETPFFKRVTSSLFYRFVSAISDFEIRPGTADFRLLDRKVVDALNGLGERTVFLRGSIPWLGFRPCEIAYTPDKRAHGVPKYNLGRMALLALDGISSSSIRPLRLSTILGIGMSALAAIYGSYALIMKLAVGSTISGWASLLIGVMLLGGVQLVMLGIIGEYLGKVLLEVKGRPPYIVREKSDRPIGSSVADLGARRGSHGSLPHAERRKRKNSA